MLSIKEINKIKSMYYDNHLTVTMISRRMKVSKATIYKYLKYYNFNLQIKVNKKRFESLAPYKDIIISWLEDDRKHHRKQRHTARRVFDRLRSEFTDFSASYYSTNAYFKELKTMVFQLHNGYLPLSHSPGECQVDVGECSYVENNNKRLGYYLVIVFPYSNASYVQLLKSKNTECLLTAMQKIFEYIGGVPHTCWFDNDTSLVRVEKTDEIKRYLTSTFTRFKLHYDFKEVFCSVSKGHEKGSVEAAIRYTRKNLLVPVPCLNDFDEYNRELLVRSSVLHNREHYITECNISDLHFDDINELNPLPAIPFEVSSINKRKLDNFGRLLLDNKIYYYISPLYAYKTIQLKLTSETISVYTVHGEHLLTTNRIYSKNGSRFINWIPYLKLLIDKPNARYNFDISELFSQNMMSKISQLDKNDYIVFISSFVSLAEEKGLDEALQIITIHNT